MEIIEIRVDADIAKTHQSASLKQHQKVQALVNSWLKRAIQMPQLQITMDCLSDEAEASHLKELNF